MTAAGSGVTPDPGFTYANQLLFYSRDESKADDGRRCRSSGQNAVIMDMNSFVWVSRRTFLGGAQYSRRRDAAGREEQLSSTQHGRVSGGGGFADSYYLPLILGWNKERASIRALSASSPQPALRAGREHNVGIGVLDADVSSGQTWYPPGVARRRSPRSRCTNSTTPKRARASILVTT